MLDVRKLFELYCGPDVRYISHSIDTIGRSIRFDYQIPSSSEPDRIFVVQGVLRNGLNSSKALAVRGAANLAMQDGYVRSGRRDRDMQQLLQGKLASEASVDKIVGGSRESGAT